MVRQAELLAEIEGGQSDGSAVGQAYSQAMQAYDRACSMTSSEQGDDLPGLLHNWGVGLRSMADHQQVYLQSQTGTPEQMLLWLWACIVQLTVTLN